MPNVRKITQWQLKVAGIIFYWKGILSPTKMHASFNHSFQLMFSSLPILTHSGATRVSVYRGNGRSTQYWPHRSHNNWYRPFNVSHAHACTSWIQNGDVNRGDVRAADVVSSNLHLRRVDLMQNLSAGSWTPGQLIPWKTSVEKRAVGYLNKKKPRGQLYCGLQVTCCWRNGFSWTPCGGAPAGQSQTLVQLLCR